MLVFALTSTNKVSTLAGEQISSVDLLQHGELFLAAHLLSPDYVLLECMMIYFHKCINLITYMYFHMSMKLP